MYPILGLSRKTGVERGIRYCFQPQSGNAIVTARRTIHRLTQNVLCHSFSVKWSNRASCRNDIVVTNVEIQPRRL